MQIHQQHENLSGNLWIINRPLDYAKCLGTVASIPKIFSKTKPEEKVHTFYFYNLNSLNDIVSKISGIYALQLKKFKMSLSFGFIYEIKETIQFPDFKITKVAYNASRASNKDFMISSVLIENSNDIRNKVINKLTEDNIKTFGEITDEEIKILAPTLQKILSFIINKFKYLYTLNLQCVCTSQHKSLM